MIGGNSPLHRAAALVQKHPLCLSNHSGTWSERGFFAGLQEAGEALTAICGVEPVEGTAFGRPWPFFESDQHILAPALPVPVSTTEILGPDGSYQRVGMTLERESAGLIDPFLRLEAGVSQPSSNIDLLWFSENERFILNGPSLEISSLFAEFTLTAHRSDLDRMLRFMNLDGDPLGVREPVNAPDQPAGVRVGKPLVLIDGDRWKDPEVYLKRRPEIKDVDISGSTLVATALDDEKSTYQSTITESGWILDLAEGRSFYRRINVLRTHETLILSAQIDDSLDTVRSDVRARIAFDLNADF